MIDTHAYYRALKGGGFSDEQAEAMTGGLATVMTGTLATKTDIAEARAEIANLRTGLKTDIAEVRTEIADVRTDLANLRAEFKSDLGKHSFRVAGFLATYTTLMFVVATAINHFVR